MRACKCEYSYVQNVCLNASVKAVLDVGLNASLSASLNAFLIARLC